MEVNTKLLLYLQNELIIIELESVDGQLCTYNYVCLELEYYFKNYSLNMTIENRLFVKKYIYSFWYRTQ